MSQLSKYRYLEGLGKGSFGSTTLVALRSNPSKKYVIKEIDLAPLLPAEIPRAKAEAEVLKNMNHSNITTCIESFVEGHKLYIVMENAEGGELFEAIESRRRNNDYWKEKEVLHYLAQMCMGVRHAHSAHVVHRDIKPQNIFLNRGVIKLGDFGASKIIEATTAKLRSRAGTHEYMCPEIVQLNPYGSACDVWSLGVVLYQMLALDLPFPEPGLHDLLQSILHKEPDYTTLESRYSGAIIDLVKRMLSKDPELRPSVAQILETDLLQPHTGRMISYTYKLTRGPPMDHTKPMTLSKLIFGSHDGPSKRKVRRAYKSLNINSAERRAIEDEAANQPDCSNAWKKIYRAANVLHLEVLWEKIQVQQDQNTSAEAVNTLLDAIGAKRNCIQAALEVLALRFADKNWNVYSA